SPRTASLVSQSPAPVPGAVNLSTCLAAAKLHSLTPCSQPQLNHARYDNWGNLLAKTVINGSGENLAALTVDSDNHIAGFGYDPAGNMISDGTNSMTYDAENRRNPTSGTTFTYDGDGRRVAKSDGTLYWVDDDLRPLSIGTSTGSITKDFVFLGSKRIAFIALSTGNPYYYLSDHLGSTAVIGSGDGKAIEWEADYFPFGNQRQIFTNLVNNTYQFTGYEYDSSSGYNYAIARFESGRLSRFLSPDPYLGSMDVTNPQSLNRYAYVMSDPLNNTDPAGLVGGGDPDDRFFDYLGGMFGGGGGECTINGFGAPCGFVQGFIDDGSVIICPDNDCSIFNHTFTQPNGRGSYTLVPGVDGLIWINNKNGEEISDEAAEEIGLMIGGDQLPSQLPVGTPQKVWNPFTHALKDAEKRVQKKKCSNFYGGQGLTTLQSTHYRFFDFGKTEGGETHEGFNVFLNSSDNGPFMSPPKSFLGINSSGIRSLIILHELGHELSAITGFVDDAGPSRLSINNMHSQEVIDHCF
ncbi:MAG TPA: RHS repeat-associated core domain-containing protein, partial [Terriglobales bacterium]|nr:RHS repeat-associated core domain-containing protein [Terriglobales bacterium]